MTTVVLGSRGLSQEADASATDGADAGCRLKSPDTFSVQEGTDLDDSAETVGLKDVANSLRIF